MYVKTFTTFTPTVSPEAGSRPSRKSSQEPISATHGPRSGSPRAAGRFRRGSSLRNAGLIEATETARELTLRAVQLTLRSGRHDSGDESLALAAALRCTTAGIALGLETRTAQSLLGALHSLWRASELIDDAERAGLLEIDEAVELLILGSQVEISLVSFLRRCGLERLLELGPQVDWPPVQSPGSPS